jgi:hypothetical protein
VNTKYCCEDPPRRRRRNAHRVTVHGSRQQRRVLIGTIEHDEPLARAMHAPDGPLMVGTPTCPYRRSSPRRAVSTCRIGPECGVQYCSVRDRVLPPFSFLSTCSEDPKHAARGGRVPCAVRAAPGTGRHPLFDATPQSPLGHQSSVHPRVRVRVGVSLSFRCEASNSKGELVVAWRLAVKRARRKASVRPPARHERSTNRPMRS